MTGGDRALISSLEGLEDLQVVGKIQLQDHNIKRGDVVFAVTEGTLFLGSVPPTFSCVKIHK